jgi:hypothetical protein
MNAGEPRHAVVQMDGRLFIGDIVLGDLAPAAGSHLTRTWALWEAAKMLVEREHDKDVRDVPGLALAKAFTRELGCTYGPLP